MSDNEKTFSEQLRDSTAHLPPSAVPSPAELPLIVGALVHAIDGAGGAQLAEHLPEPAKADGRDSDNPDQGYSRADEDFDARVNAEVQRRIAAHSERQPASTDAAPEQQPASSEPGSQPTPRHGSGNDAA